VCPSGSTGKRENPTRTLQYLSEVTSSRSVYLTHCTHARSHARLEKKHESDRREAKKSVLEKQTRV